MGRGRHRRFCNQLGLGHLSIHSIQAIYNKKYTCVVHEFRSNPRRRIKICTSLFTHFTLCWSLFLLDRMTARSLGCPVKPSGTRRSIPIPPLPHPYSDPCLEAPTGVTVGEVAMLVELKKSTWASMRGGRLPMDKSTTVTETRDTLRLLPPVLWRAHVNYGAVACCSEF